MVFFALVFLAMMLRVGRKKKRQKKEKKEKKKKITIYMMHEMIAQMMHALMH